MRLSTISANPYPSASTSASCIALLMTVLLCLFFSSMISVFSTSWRTSTRPHETTSRSVLFTRFSWVSVFFSTRLLYPLMMHLRSAPLSVSELASSPSRSNTVHRFDSTHLTTCSRSRTCAPSLSFSETRRYCSRMALQSGGEAERFSSLPEPCWSPWRGESGIEEANREREDLSLSIVIPCFTHMRAARSGARFAPPSSSELKGSARTASARRSAARPDPRTSSTGVSLLTAACTVAAVPGPPSTQTHTAGIADAGRRAAFCTPVMFIPCHPRPWRSREWSTASVASCE
mmetsp:Transcript_19216/g.43226  ORF Transcript_19216/g.43226 Transcript_19216/m.43226 type:complete len:290 (-) Transcript_19216:562-1431(-)